MKQKPHKKAWKQSIKLIHAPERMLICGVAMEKFVLNETLKCAELGEVAPENPAPVHDAKGARYLALLLQDCPEGSPVFRAVIEALVDPVPVGFNQFP